MSIHIKSPSNYFKDVFKYFWFLFREVDLIRSKKYLIFTFLMPLMIDVVDFFSKGEFFIWPPLMSIISTTIFFSLYCLGTFLMRWSYWHRNLVILKSRVFVSDGSGEKLIGEIVRVNKVGERIVEIVFDREDSLKFKSKFLDIVFMNSSERDDIFSRINGEL